VIDSHVHVWTLEPERYPWHQTLAHVPVPVEPATAEELLSEMDHAGVHRAVLVQPSVYGWDNSYLCEWLERRPDRFVGVCLVDARSPDAASELRYWCGERGCRGVRINVIAERDASWILDRAREPLWRAARELAASISFQMLPSQAPVVDELAAREPELVLVVDYLGSDAFHDGSGVRALDLLGGRPNVWFKVIASGPDSRESYPFRDLWPMYERAVERFGPDRTVFGTDFPHVRRACTYQQAIAWLAKLPFLDHNAVIALADVSPSVLWGLADGHRRFS
jgi:predicted TIM-barrel fold metal-dependent hydrolase